MALSVEDRKTKGRENRQRIAEAQQKKQEGTHELPHVSTLTPGPKLPVTQREVQAYLTGRYDHMYRGPVNRAERRKWDRWWKLKGRGFTKPMKRGERF